MRRGARTEGRRRPRQQALWGMCLRATMETPRPVAEPRPSGAHPEQRARALGLVILMGLVLGALALAAPKVLGGTFSNPDTRIQTLLHDTLVDGTAFDVPGSQTQLKGQRVKLSLPVVHQIDADHAVAIISLDVTGSFGETRVSALGYERIPFERDARGRWRAPQGYAPRLTASLSRLEARREALEAGQSATLDVLSIDGAPPAAQLKPVRALVALKDRRYRVETWLLRSERDWVEIGEHYRVQGTLPERPVDEKGLRNLRLVPSEGGLLFSPPLM